MEYELIYHTRLYVVLFEITTWGVKATIYNKNVPCDQEWILIAKDELEIDCVSTEFQLCRELLKYMRKERKI